MIDEMSKHALFHSTANNPLRTIPPAPRKADARLPRPTASRVPPACMPVNASPRGEMRRWGGGDPAPRPAARRHAVASLPSSPRRIARRFSSSAGGFASFSGHRDVKKTTPRQLVLAQCRAVFSIYYYLWLLMGMGRHCGGCVFVGECVAAMAGSPRVLLVAVWWAGGGCVAMLREKGGWCVCVRCDFNLNCF